MNKKELLKRIHSGYGLTHPATFHADDVLSTCLLRLINPNIKIIRSNMIPTEFCGIAYDIGLGDYDHHQSDAKVRDNDIKYAAFGLLWKDLSAFFMDDEHAAVFDAAFVSEIDRCDNGSDTNLLSSSIELFNPTWNSTSNADQLFENTVKIFTPVLKAMINHFKQSTFVPRYCRDLDECLHNAFSKSYQNITGTILDIPPFADIQDIWEMYSYIITPNEEPEFFIKTFLSQVKKTYGKYKTSPFVISISCLRKQDRIKLLSTIMERRFDYINSLDSARQKCEKIYQESKRKDLIILDHYMPYDQLVENHELVKTIIFPSNRKGYNLLCANMSVREKQRNNLNVKKVHNRMSFPNELRGREESFLNNYSAGLFFVHPSGYMASCDTLENAIKFYEKVKN